ncbi:MAG: DUF3298 domain-containing protein [Bacteroidaceae bacterium]|nr:DUF3298 domain-containing protein [Bacteroidaceae bacterium]
MKKITPSFLLLTISVLLLTTLGCSTKEVKYDVVEERRESRLVNGDPVSPQCEVFVHMPFLPTDGDEDVRKVATKINNQLLKEFFNSVGEPHEAVSQFVENYLKEYKEDRYEYYVSERSTCEAEDTSFLNHAYSAYLSIEGAITPGREGIVGFTVNQEVYNGGAHPVSTTYYVNFNTVTGDEVKISDLFLTGTLDQLTDRITKAIAQNNGVRDKDELLNLGYDEIGTPQEYLFGRDSITFFYNVYEIGPYALGSTEVKIAYKDLEDIMVK